MDGQDGSSEPKLIWRTSFSTFRLSSSRSDLFFFGGSAALQYRYVHLLRAGVCIRPLPAKSNGVELECSIYFIFRPTDAQFWTADVRAPYAKRLQRCHGKTHHAVRTCSIEGVRAVLDNFPSWRGLWEVYPHIWGRRSIPPSHTPQIWPEILIPPGLWQLKFGCFGQ